MGQACLNRGLFPCQDAPRSRMTWAARVTAPAEFLVVAAAPSTKGPKTLKDGRRAFRFAMPVKVPAYLVAFAVGDLASRDVGPRSRVYAHPRKVEAAAKEFAGVTEKYLKAGEALFGTYSWGRYDLLMMPRAFAYGGRANILPVCPGFTTYFKRTTQAVQRCKNQQQRRSYGRGRVGRRYGGMENPTLTYLSSTLVVGDGSLTDTVAHEIAHSWFGNLVTNGSWAEFFLNEGFTMYAQRRITRARPASQMMVAAPPSRRRVRPSRPFRPRTFRKRRRRRRRSDHRPRGQGGLAPVGKRNQRRAAGRRALFSVAGPDQLERRPRRHVPATALKRFFYAIQEGRYSSAAKISRNAARAKRRADVPRYNDVPYEKGYALLCAMRDAVVDACFVEFSQDQRAAALDPWLRQ